MPITRERAALLFQEKFGPEEGLEILEFLLPAGREAPATRGELSETELRLRKEIEGVRLEVEGVRREIKELELRLRKEITNLRLEVGKEIEGVRLEVGKGIEGVRLEVGKEIAGLKVELSRQTNRLMLIIGGILAVLKLLDYVLPPP